MVNIKPEESRETNIGYWEQVLKAPTPAYQELFDAEKGYILENIPQNAFVLDIGCGEGRNMASIMQNTRNVYGVDNDQKAVEDAKKKFEGIDTIQVIRASAVELPFKDETFDVVTFLMILPNLGGSKSSAIQESTRVLKHDGKLILSTFAETAFDERMKIYKIINAPIKEVRGTTVVFDESLGANVSEQFSLDDLKEFGLQAGLQLDSYKKVGDIAYLCTFRKL